MYICIYDVPDRNSFYLNGIFDQYRVNQFFFNNKKL